MNRRLLAVVVVVWASLYAVGAETAAQKTTTEKLPVRRVVLYKNGVGYFEHTGHVHGNQSLNIDFTSSQLNDALKSLTVLDLDGGKISGVGYNSVAPVAEQLRSLRPEIASYLSAISARCRSGRAPIGSCCRPNRMPSRFSRAGRL